MPNKNYLKGVRKERRFVNDARKAGLVAFRSAGSHSPIDVIIIDPEIQLIRLIQCKPDNYPPRQIKKLEIENKDLNGEFAVKFEVR